jgi:hypothetical protein
MFHLASRRIIRLTLAPLLALWVGGTGCLFGCEMRAQAGDDTTQLAAGDAFTLVSGEACASAKSHDCCAKRNRSKANVIDHQLAGRTGNALVGFGQNTSGLMEPCPLAINATAVVSKVRTTKYVSLPAINYNIPASQSKDEQHLSLSTHLVLPNRGHTYLVCCTFLI